DRSCDASCGWTRRAARCAGRRARWATRRCTPRPRPPPPLSAGTLCLPPRCTF
ncbi:hypothetical protein HK405_013621, partial [Cladochytrium tenue]